MEATLLADKVAIVTGSSSGLGEAIAMLFVSRGAKVTLCGRDPARLRSVLDQALQIGGGQEDKVLAVQGDLNDHTVREQVVNKTVEKFGRLDILVANAGQSDTNCSLENATEEAYNKIMDTNVKSVFFLIQLAVPHLERSRGTIINISSIASTLTTTTATIYHMSKAALDHLTRCLAVDLGQKGIRINSINPSFIATRILRYLGGDIEKITEERVEHERSKHPLQGRQGSAQDVAEAAAFLASEAAGFITGQILRVDGGRAFGEPGGWKTPKQ